MADIELLSHKIHDLKDWQTLAWRRMANPDVTAFERREIRNHLKECDAELRRCLGQMSDYLLNQPRPAPVMEEEVGNSLANIKFKLFA